MQKSKASAKGGSPPKAGKRLDGGKKREAARQARHRRVRKKVVGTSQCPRLCVHKSHKNIIIHFIDDAAGKVLLTLSTNSKPAKEQLSYGGNCKAAACLGEAAAQNALKIGIKKIVFDRGGYSFHGRVKALAEGARKGGLSF